MQGWRRAMGSEGEEDEGGTSGFGPPCQGSAGADYPYQVVRLLGGEGEEALVALAATPMTAFAAYYAAVREHLGSTVVLKHKGRVIQRTGPKGATA